MRLKVAKRARIARVRRIQHSHAAAIAMRAETHAAMLETSAERLGQLRLSLSAGEGASRGAVLAGLGELSMRLDDARHGLADAIATARANAVYQAEVRLEARRQQESANKLESHAADALDRFLERNAIPVSRRKAAPMSGDTQ